MEVQVGHFVHPGRGLCTVWSEASHWDWLEHKVNRAIEMCRAMQQDIGFGIRQIVDIALRALSPGVNDPTNAHECIGHLGAISYEILRRDLPPAEIAGEEGRRIILPRQVARADFVATAFDEKAAVRGPLGIRRVPSFAAPASRPVGVGVPAPAMSHNVASHFGGWCAGKPGRRDPSTRDPGAEP